VSRVSFKSLFPRVRSLALCKTAVNPLQLGGDSTKPAISLYAKRSPKWSIKRS